MTPVEAAESRGHRLNSGVTDGGRTFYSCTRCWLTVWTDAWNPHGAGLALEIDCASAA